MKKPDIHILANSRTIRAFQTVPGDPSLGEGRDSDHLAEIRLAPAVAQPESGYEERSDRLGRFEKGTPVGSQGGMAHGERHGEASENKRRQTAALARSIEAVLNEQQPPAWGLVAPEHLLNELVDALGNAFTSSLIAREKGDWTKEPIAAIEKRILGTAS